MSEQGFKVGDIVRVKESDGRQWRIASIENIIESPYGDKLYILRDDVHDVTNAVFWHELEYAEEPKFDVVNKARHYNLHPSGVECIDIIRHYDFDIGCAIKYLWRCGLKHEQGMTDKEKEIEDLRKAVYYINDKIKQLENGKRIEE